MTKSKVLAFLNTLGFVLVLVLNGLANGLPLNGYTTGELSALYPNLFVPAGFTFSIWGLIYFFLGGFAVYQLKTVFFTKSEPTEAIALIGSWFFISCLANAAWIVAWHFQFPLLSLVLMLVLLLSLIQIYRNLGLGIRKASTPEKWWVQAPFSLYLSWISVATIANSAAVLVHLDFNGWGLPDQFWAAALVMVAGLLALFFLRKNYDFVYAGVIIWACFGIFYRRSYLANIDTPAITTSAAAVALLLLYHIMRHKRSFKGTRAY